MRVSKLSIYLIGVAVADSKKAISPHIANPDEKPEGFILTEFIFSSRASKDFWFRGYARPEVLNLLRKVHPLCQGDRITVGQFRRITHADR